MFGQAHKPSPAHDTAGSAWRHDRTCGVSDQCPNSVVFQRAGCDISERLYGWSYDRHRAPGRLHTGSVRRPRCARGRPIRAHCARGRPRPMDRRRGSSRVVVPHWRGRMVPHRAGTDPGGSHLCPMPAQNRRIHLFRTPASAVRHGTVGRDAGTRETGFVCHGTQRQPWRIHPARAVVVSVLPGYGVAVAFAENRADMPHLPTRTLPIPVRTTPDLRWGSFDQAQRAYPLPFGEYYQEPLTGRHVPSSLFGYTTVT